MEQDLGVIPKALTSHDHVLRHLHPEPIVVLMLEVSRLLVLLEAELERPQEQYEPEVVVPNSGCICIF